MVKSDPRKYRVIPRLPHLRISREGEVVTCKHYFPVKVRTLNTSGKKKYRVLKTKGNGLEYIHVLLLETYVSARPDGHLGLHKNDISLDNRIENLYWGTHSQNAQDRELNKRKGIGGV